MAKKDYDIGSMGPSRGEKLGENPLSHLISNIYKFRVRGLVVAKQITG